MVYNPLDLPHHHYKCTLTLNAALNLLRPKPVHHDLMIFPLSQRIPIPSSTDNIFLDNNSPYYQSHTSTLTYFLLGVNALTKRMNHRGTPNPFNTPTIILDELRCSS